MGIGREGTAGGKLAKLNPNTAVLSSRALYAVSCLNAHRLFTAVNNTLRRAVARDGAHDGPLRSVSAILLHASLDRVPKDIISAVVVIV